MLLVVKAQNLENAFKVMWCHLHLYDSNYEKKEQEWPDAGKKSHYSHRME